MPKIFISHSSKDRVFIEATLLPMLHKHEVQTWYSSANIPSASDWEKVIRSALVDCDWFLVVLSHNALASDWVQAEVHWALDHRKDRFVSLLLDDCTPSNLHLKLIRYQHIDFRQTTDDGSRLLVEALGLQYLSIPQLRLAYRIRGDTEPRYQLVISDSAFIGRASDSAIRVPSTKASRRHGILKVRTQGGQRSLWLTDMGSISGILCNGTPVQAAIEIKAGDCIVIADYQIEVVAVTPT